MFFNIIREKESIELKSTGFLYNYDFVITHFDKRFPISIEISYSNPELYKIYTLSNKEEKIISNIMSNEYQIKLEEMWDDRGENIKEYNDKIISLKKDQVVLRDEINKLKFDLFNNDAQLSIKSAKTKLLIGEESFTLADFYKKDFDVFIPSNNGEDVKDFPEEEKRKIKEKINEIAIKNIKQLTNIKSHVKF